MQSRTGLLFRALAVDLVGSVLYFPIWWYTAGTLRAARWCVGKVTDAARSFGVVVWLKNLFTPMFGQYDLSGRIISFVMRLAAVLFYSSVLVVLAAAMTSVFVLWLAVPALVVFELAVQFGLPIDRLGV